MAARKFTTQERIDRFWAKAHKSDSCWLWTGGKSSRGYGKVSDDDRRTVGAHVFAWRITYGDIPEGMCICHKCDTPACVNPDHLFIGTHADNSADRDRKGRTATGDRAGFRVHPESAPRGDNHPRRKHPERYARGSQIWNSKLDERTVLAIQSAIQSGETQMRIAERFGVSNTAVTNIKHRRVWKHLIGHQ